MFKEVREGCMVGQCNNPHTDSKIERNEEKNSESDG